MSKKRALIFMLALLPLAVGGAVVATLADGSRSSELASLPEAATPQEVPSDAADAIAPSIGAPQAHLLSPSRSTLASSEVREPRVQELRDENHSTITRSEVTPPAPLLASGGGVASDVQIAALVDGGWQLRQRFHPSSGAASGLGGGGGGSAGGDTASGQMPSDTNGSGENTASIPIDEEYATRQPSEGPPDGSDDENSGSVAGEDSVHPSTKHDEDTKSHEEELVEQYPIYDGGKGPIYIPPQETNPSVVSVPEPATLGLLGLGLIGCAVARRRKAS